MCKVSTTHREKQQNTWKNLCGTNDSIQSRIAEMKEYLYIREVKTSKFCQICLIFSNKIRF